MNPDSDVAWTTIGDIIDHAITKILPERLSHWVVRMKYIAFQQAQFMFAKTLPKVNLMKWRSHPANC